MKQTIFRVTLTDSAGKPVSGASVVADLTMPAMDMGKNQVTFAERGAGRYEGSGKFTMGGDWEIAVTAAKEAAKGKSTFHVTVEL